MKHLFSSLLTGSSKRVVRVGLLAGLLAVTLGVGLFSFTPTAHAIGGPFAVSIPGANITGDTVFHTATTFTLENVKVHLTGCQDGSWNAQDQDANFQSHPFSGCNTTINFGNLNGSDSNGVEWIVIHLFDDGHSGADGRQSNPFD